jgi:hypothetical protein
MSSLLAYPSRALKRSILHAGKESQRATARVASIADLKNSTLRQIEANKPQNSTNQTSLAKAPKLLHVPKATGLIHPAQFYKLHISGEEASKMGLTKASASRTQSTA